jgi:hypothetical protein
LWLFKPSNTQLKPDQGYMAAAMVGGVHANNTYSRIHLQKPDYASQCD